MVIIPSLPSVMEKVGSRERREDRLSFLSDLCVDGQSKEGDMCMNYPLITGWCPVIINFFQIPGFSQYSIAYPYGICNATS